MANLAEKNCIPCMGGVPPLKGEALKKLQQELNSSWNVQEEHHLEKEFIFKNFKEALAFTVKVGEIAEQQNHHPDISLAWGKVKITIFTHKINGLAESDFILAAKIEKL